MDAVLGPFEFAQVLNLSMKDDQSAIFENSDLASLKNADLQALYTSVLPSATEDFVENYFWNNIVCDSEKLRWRIPHKQDTARLPRRWVDWRSVSCITYMLVWTVHLYYR